MDIVKHKIYMANFYSQICELAAEKNHPIFNRLQKRLETVSDPAQKAKIYDLNDKEILTLSSVKYIIDTVNKRLGEDFLIALYRNGLVSDKDFIAVIDVMKAEYDSQDIKFKEIATDDAIRNALDAFMGDGVVVRIAKSILSGDYENDKNSEECF